MVNTESLEKAFKLIKKSANILITTHTKPDGDALGCISAMYDVLTSLDKKVQPLFLSPAPRWYEFLFAEKVPVLGEDVGLEDLKAGTLGKFDLIMIIDTNSYSQLPKFDEYLRQNNKPVLVIDHHITSDSLGMVELVESDAAAAGLVVLELFKYAGWPITQKIAESLFVAISTDTGWFQFNNTDSRVFSSCAELIGAGAKPSEIYHKIYENFSYQRLRLVTLMLGSLHLHFNGRFATMQITQRDLKQTGATYADTDNLINECRRLGTVDTIALFTELGDGRIRCSLRSKGAVDVGQIAAKFGGGGHKMAAGTYLPSPLEQANQIILQEIKKLFS